MTGLPQTTGPESIVVSLEYAKKLKEAGWPQETVWYWPVHSVNGHVFPPTRETHPRSVNHALDYFAAPTAEEILRRLPIFVPNAYGHEYALEINAYVGGQFGVSYKKTTPPHNVKTGTYFATDTLANAAAAMYCHLAEQGLLPKP